MSKTIKAIEEREEAPIDLLIIQELEDVDEGLTPKQLARCIQPGLSSRYLSHELTSLISQGLIERRGRRVVLKEEAISP
jgi:DNA-binding HxlR family transcriptional regulator